MFDLVPFKRRHDVPDVFTEMDDMFKRMWEGFPFTHDLMTDDRSRWNPSLDVSETETAYEVVADLPGLSKEDIDISLDNNVLVIKGEKKEEEKKTGKQYLRVERRYGSFYRSFRLPAEVKSDEIDASFKNGVLKVTLPKTEEAKKKIAHIEVH